MAIGSVKYSKKWPSKRQGKKVMGSLEREIDETPDGGYFLSFLDNWFQREAQIVHCRDPENKEWVNANVGEWICEESTGLIAIEIGYLQKLCRAFIRALALTSQKSF